MQWVLDEADKPQNAGKSLKDLRPNFYQMMRWLNTAWQECVSPLTISNCWYKAGILPEGWISAPTSTSRERARAAKRALAGEEAAQPAMQPAAMSTPHQSAAEAADESEVASSEAAHLPDTEAGSPADSADGQDNALELLRFDILRSDCSQGFYCVLVGSKILSSRRSRTIIDAES
jgi:hypothetical protein